MHTWRAEFASGNGSPSTNSSDGNRVVSFFIRDPSHTRLAPALRPGAHTVPEA